MSMSGVAVDDECVKIWQLLKTKKIKAANFKLTSDFRKIVVEENSIIPRNPRDPPNPDFFEQWTSSLPEAECRYAIYDAEIGINLGAGVSTGSRSKLVFVTWAPGCAKIKDKMVSASSKDALKKKFDGIQIEWQLNDEQDYEASAIIEDMQCLPDIKTSGKIQVFEGRPVGDW